MSVIIASTVAWISLRNDVRGAVDTNTVQDKRLDTIETRNAVDHDILLRLDSYLNTLQHEKIGNVGVSPELVGIIIAAITNLVTALYAKRYRDATHLLVDSIEQASNLNTDPKGVVARNAVGAVAKLIEQVVDRRTNVDEANQAGPK